MEKAEDKRIMCFRKAQEEGLKIEAIQADKTGFRLDKKADFAFIMMRSFAFKSNEDMIRLHLRSKVEAYTSYRTSELIGKWTGQNRKHRLRRRREGIKVRATYETSVKNIINQSSRRK